MESVKYLSHSVIKNVLKYEPLIKALQESLGIFSQRHEKDTGIDQPVRTVIMIPEQNGFFGSMPVYCRHNNILSTKLLTFFPNGGLNSTILVFNAENGKPEAILDGEDISAKRTAAASVVATKFLVNGEPESLALLGSGTQARSHHAALSIPFKFKEIRIWNHRKAGADQLASEIGDIAAACDSAEAAVRGADVIVTATSSATPVLRAEWVKKGAHINAVGACRPDWAEVDKDLMKSSVIYADSREGVLKESGDVVLSKAPIYAEIGEVVNGTKEARRTETTVFESVGMALEDAVAIRIVLDQLK